MPAARGRRRSDSLHLDLLRENENGKIHLAAQQIGALKICQLLAEFDLALLRKTLEQEPEGFLHLLQMLPKLSQGGMACEEVGLEVAKRKVKLGKAKIPPHKRGHLPGNTQAGRRETRPDVISISHDLPLFDHFFPVSPINSPFFP